MDLPLAAWIVFAAHVVLVGVLAAVTIPGGREPNAAVAWVLSVALLPVVGVLAFVLIGHPRLPRQRRRIHSTAGRRMRQQVEALYGECAALDPEARAVPDAVPKRLRPAARLASSDGALPPMEGNRVEMIDQPKETVRRMVEDVGRARHFVHVEFYTLALDETTEPFVNAIEDASRRGVRVRVLFDHAGSRSYARHGRLLQRLDAAGIAWKRSLPLLPLQGYVARPDLRNHRKILVVDDAVAFTGSMNLIDPSYHERIDHETLSFSDVFARLEGPVVQALDGVFRTDWHAEGGDMVTDHGTTEPEERGPDADPAVCQVLPTGPGHPYENALRMLNAMLHRAQRRALLVTPYFVPDHSLLMSITSAAARGVEVTLLTNERADHGVLGLAQESFYDDLLAAGVDVRLHPFPGIMHTKLVAIDDDMVLFGSSNLDMRSLHLNLEACVVTYGGGVVDQVGSIAARYLHDAKRLTPESWRSKPLRRQWLQRAARLTSSLQ